MAESTKETMMLLLLVLVQWLLPLPRRLREILPTTTARTTEGHRHHHHCHHCRCCLPHPSAVAVAVTSRQPFWPVLLVTVVSSLVVVAVAAGRVSFARAFLVISQPVGR